MEYLTNALVAFAKDPENGLLNYGWPKYKVNGGTNSSSFEALRNGGDTNLVSFLGSTLIRLGYNNQTTASFVSPSVYDGPCAAFNGDTSLGMGAM